MSETSDKYPRTPHLPWSPGCTKDDRRITDVTPLLDTSLVITEKMDGANVCLEREQVFARSHNAAPRHESYDALKALHAALRWHIPPHWQVFGEWLWARHSIGYDRLPAYLLVFGIRDTREEEWLAWHETTQECAPLGLQTVPVLWQGSVCSEPELSRLTQTLVARCGRGPQQEGVVVRVAARFADADFAVSVAKWVRAAHVTTEQHWSAQKIVRNRLASDKLE